MLSDLNNLHARWDAAWPEALAAWSSFTKLHRPTWCFSAREERNAGLSGSFAMIRLLDHRVVISLRQIAEYELDEFAAEILAHEIGHHVYAPANLVDNAQLQACIRHSLPTYESSAGLIANLYTDLLINDRLQRIAGMNIAGVYAQIVAHDGSPEDPLWRLYFRSYEVLWNLAPGTLVRGEVEANINLDATIIARLVRAYSKYWLQGAGRFAAICLDYLIEMNHWDTPPAVVSVWLDSQQAGEGDEIPDGIAYIAEIEREDAVHPRRDPKLGGLAPLSSDKSKAASRPGKNGLREKIGGQKNNYRSPLQYIDLMQSIGVEVDPNKLIIQYYKELARPHFIKFPTRRMPVDIEPSPEGVEPWEIGAPVSRIDWMATVIQSPYIIPGVTTVERTYARGQSPQPKLRAVDLYLGIDSSGSMNNPTRDLSHPVLAGAIMVTSALRAGAKVMSVLSGADSERDENVSSDGFSRNEREHFGVLTSYLGMGYAFGILQLKTAFLGAKAPERACHILLLTDADIFYMMDEVRGGWEIARDAAQRAGGGATCVLEIPNPDAYSQQLARLRDIGWTPYLVNNQNDIVEFARKFSKDNYERSPRRR